MKLFSTARRATQRAVAAWGLLIALSACGGGVVGTGTGTGDDPDDIAYTAVGLCTADFAGDNLVCPAVSIDPFRGTATVQWADTDKSNDAATVLNNWMPKPSDSDLLLVVKLMLALDPKLRITLLSTSKTLPAMYSSRLAIAPTSLPRALSAACTAS